MPAEDRARSAHQPKRQHLFRGEIVQPLRRYCRCRQRLMRAAQTCGEGAPRHRGLATTVPTWRTSEGNVCVGVLRLASRRVIIIEGAWIMGEHGRQHRIAEGVADLARLELQEGQ